VDWLQILQGDANEQWNTFISIMRKFEYQYIPLKKPSRQNKKAPWMSFIASKLVNKKHKLYKKYKCKSHPAYMKVAREAQIEIRRAKRSFERKLAKSTDTDRKSFYA